MNRRGHPGALVCGAVFVAAALFLNAAWAASASAASRFEPWVAYSVGGWPESVAIGEFTGDGLHDVVMTTGSHSDPENDHKLFLFRQLPSGLLADGQRFHFAGGREATTWNAPGMPVASGDLNADAIDDAVSVSPDGLEIFYGGMGTLSPPEVLGPPSRVRTLQLADMNGDGLLDIVVSTGESGSEPAQGLVLVFSNTPGGFVATEIARGLYRNEIEVGDVNDDGLSDIVGLPYIGNQIEVLLQGSDGQFRKVLYDSGIDWPLYGLEIAEVTGDHREDVVVTVMSNWPTSELRLFPQGPAGTLGAPLRVPSLDIPEPIEAADLNGDHTEDLVTAHGGHLTLGVYLRLPDGSLTSEERYDIPYASHYTPGGLAIGDVNSDDKPDVVIADYSDGLIVLRQPGRPVSPPASPPPPSPSPPPHAVPATLPLAPPPPSDPAPPTTTPPASAPTFQPPPAPGPSVVSTSSPSSANSLAVLSLSTTRRVRWGRFFAARLQVAATQDGPLPVTGNVVCRASVGRHLARLQNRGFKRGTAFCLWKLPSRVHGNRLTGRIAVRALAGTAQKSFTRRIRT